MFARRENDKPLHLGLTAHCGLCGTVLKVGEACTALLGVDHASRYRRRVPPFAYPKYGFFHGEVSAGLDPDDAARLKVEGKEKHEAEAENAEPMLCRNPECTKGTATLEACTVHVDCHVVFRRYCVGERSQATNERSEDKDLLWVASAWRRPWRQAAWLWVDDEDEADCRGMAWAGAVTADADKGDDLGALLHRLLDLPPELADMVRDESAESLVWRYAAVIERCRPLAGEDNTLKSMPLANIAAWERGRPPRMRDATDSPVDHPVLRLTIDARGLRSVERLAARPPATHDRHTHREAFVVVDQSHVAGVTMHVKFGLARLELPRGTRTTALPIWNTPTPPSLSADCCFLFHHEQPPTRYQTIPLDHVYGLTLLFVHGKAMSVHAHTPQTPVARLNFLVLDPVDVAWVYVPIARSTGDRVVAVGARRTVEDVRAADQELVEIAEQEAEQAAQAARENAERLARGEEELEELEGEEEWNNMYRNYNVDFLFRLRLAGDVSVGPMLQGLRFDTTLATSAPISLVVSPHENHILSAVGAFTEVPKPSPLPDVDLDVPFGDLPLREVAHANDYSSFLSTAPLDKPIRKIIVFQDEVRGFDKGLLIEYADGGQRALGQCRVGIDLETDYVSPKCLCITRNSYTYMVPKPAARQPSMQHWQVFYAHCSDDICDGHSQKHDDEPGIWECIPVGEPGCGTLEVWFSSKTGRVSVFNDDDKHKAWRKERNDGSFSQHHRR